MNIQELKLKSSEQLITQAEELGIENASTLRKQEILFAILKKVAEKEEITGAGVLQLLQDGFGFLRAMESNYLPGPDDIYVSPSQIRRFGLRTGDSVEGEIRGPKDAERYFALLKVNKINFDEPDKGKNKIGSTLKGIGPTYQDKIGRHGLRVGEILSDNFKEKYEKQKSYHNYFLESYYDDNFKVEESNFFESIEKLKKFKIVDTEYLLNKNINKKKKVLAEGAQGTLLDIDFGSYPFVTSSNTTTAATQLTSWGCN